MLRAVAVATAGAFAGTATAASPAKLLAAQLKTSMQAYYAKGNPTFRMTSVTCTISADQTGALCDAHFAVPAQRAVGVFKVQVTGAGVGNARTKTLSVSCTDTKTHKKLPNC